MSQEAKNICVINNFYYINFDESDFKKKNCSLFQPFTKNYSKKTLSNINTKKLENKIIITEDNDEIPYYDNLETNRIDRNDEYKENNNNNINFSEANEKEVLFIEIPKSPKKFFNVNIKKKKG